MSETRIKEGGWAMSETRITGKRLAGRLMPALLVAPLLVLAACGPDNGSGVAPPDEAEAGRAFSQCMRDNGLPDFPDPDPDGQLRGPAHEQQSDPKFRAAQEKCRDLAPGGEHQNTGDPASVEQMRQFSQCMRDNGLPDFPDPDPDGQLRGPAHEQQSDPKFRTAQEKCRQKLPGGGDHR
jgi:hypothetical protein